MKTLILLSLVLAGCATTAPKPRMEEVKAQCRPRLYILTTGRDYVDYYNGEACWFLIVESGNDRSRLGS